jgi:hypothetical protein
VLDPLLRPFDVAVVLLLPALVAGLAAGALAWALGSFVLDLGGFNTRALALAVVLGVTAVAVRLGPISRHTQTTASAIAEARVELVFGAVERISARLRGSSRAVAPSLGRRTCGARRVASPHVIPVLLSALSSGATGKFDGGGAPPPPCCLWYGHLTTSAYPFGVEEPGLSELELHCRVRAALCYLAGGEFS